MNVDMEAHETANIDSWRFYTWVAPRLNSIARDLEDGLTRGTNLRMFIWLGDPGFGTTCWNVLWTGNKLNSYSSLLIRVISCMSLMFCVFALN